jgi:hypothetical protein
MSFGAAAQQAGVSPAELARFAYARGMEPPFSAQTLAEELGETRIASRLNLTQAVSLPQQRVLLLPSRLMHVR